MARWATLVEIAGVSFTGCRAEVLDGEGFLSVFGGSVDWANDAKPHVQTFNRGIKGIAFGIAFVSTKIEDLQTTLAAIASHQTANTPFRVKITEGLYVIDVNVVPDYNQKWLDAGKHSEGWIQDVKFRFISQAVGS